MILFLLPKILVRTHKTYIQCTLHFTNGAGRGNVGSSLRCVEAPQTLSWKRVHFRRATFYRATNTNVQKSR